MGRINIGLAFNQAIRTGRLKGPIILSRDHHDVSGTDSPFRETANIEDGSAFCAGLDLKKQKFLYNILIVLRYVRTKCNW
jgi:urocanate hydratase